jgi:hypothetical protein
MKSVIEYALSLTGICINKYDVSSAKEGVMTRSPKNGLIIKVYFVNETVLQWDVLSRSASVGMEFYVLVCGLLTFSTNVCELYSLNLSQPLRTVLSAQCSVT